MRRPRGRFTARDRVRKRSEFERIRQTGRRVVTPSFVFLLQQTSGAPGPRLGITASRRVGSAPERNRAKRLVREAFRATRGLWPSGYDVVVIVRHALGTRKLADVVSEWLGARGRIERCLDQLAKDSRQSSAAPHSEAPASKDVHAAAGAPPTGPLQAKKSC